MKAGRARARGRSGGYWQLTRAIWRIALHVPGQHPWGSLLAPVALLIPFATLASCLRDRWFAGTWGRRLGGEAASLLWGPSSTIRATIKN